VKKCFFSLLFIFKYIIDVEGFNVNDLSKNYDSIFILSILMSSLYVLNTVGGLN